MSEYPRFALEFPVRMHMTDQNGFCHAADIMRFMQETAIMQLEQWGPNYAAMQSRHQAFVLSRITIDFSIPVRYFETLSSNTWACATSHGVSFDRDFLIFNEKKETVVSAASQWALIDTQNARLLHVEDCGIDYVCGDTVATSLPLRFRIPKDANLVTVGEKIVRYSDIDNNGHMNNTHYCSLYCDFLPMTEQGAEQRVAALSIAFQREAVQGETILVTRTETPDENGVYYFRTYRSSDHAVNTEAAVRLTPIESRN